MNPPRTHRQQTNEEQQRAVELLFTRTISCWLRDGKDYVSVMKFFTALSELTGGDVNTISQLVLRLINDNRFDFPNLAEELNVLYHYGTKTQKLLRIYKISTTTFYKYLAEPYVVRLKFSPEERKAVVELMDAIRQLPKEVL